MEERNLKLVEEHLEDIEKRIKEEFENKKEIIRQKLLDEIKSYITPVPVHYSYDRGDCPYDYSGNIYRDGLVSLDQTIYDFLANEYTGNSRATYISH